MSKSTFTFEDNSEKFLRAFEKCSIDFLNEAKDSLVAQTQRNTPVDKGDLKRSFGTDSYVDENKLAAYIGSSLEYYIWIEKGTGEYAIDGDGRKGGWWYKNPKATLNKDGSVRKNSKHRGWVFTYGTKPKRMLYKAYLSKRKKISFEAGKHYARLSNG